MLRINLLPVRQLKKRATAVNQLIIAGFFIVTMILFLATAGFIQLTIANSIRSDIEGLNKIKQKNAPILAEIIQFEKKKAELERKISVIKKLKKNSSLAVRVMDEIANLIDNERMWLLTFNNRAGSLAMTGVALDNRTIADFMKALEKSPFVVKQSINLANSTLKRMSGKSLKSFSLSCSVSLPIKGNQSLISDKK